MPYFEISDLPIGLESKKMKPEHRLSTNPILWKMSIRKLGRGVRLQIRSGSTSNDISFSNCEWLLSRSTNEVMSTSQLFPTAASGTTFRSVIQAHQFGLCSVSRICSSFSKV